MDEAWESIDKSIHLKNIFHEQQATPDPDAQCVADKAPAPIDAEPMQDGQPGPADNHPDESQQHTDSRQSIDIFANDDETQGPESSSCAQANDDVARTDTVHSMDTDASDSAVPAEQPPLKSDCCERQGLQGPPTR